MKRKAAGGGPRSAGARGDEAARDLREWGVPEADIEHHLSAIGDEDGGERIPVWEESVGSLAVFLRATRCWRYGATGSLLGLDYVQVIAIMREMKVKHRDEVLQDLDAMADAVVAVYGEKA